MSLVFYVAGGGYQPRSEPRSDESGPESDTIFVSGLSDEVDAPRIAEFFGQIGIIKVRISRSLWH